MPSSPLEILKHELADANYALNRAISAVPAIFIDGLDGMTSTEKLDYENAIIARDLIWAFRQHLDPELKD